MGDRCLICSRTTEAGGEFHPNCSLSFFGTSAPPGLDISLGQLYEHATRSVLSRTTVTGVQKKLSLGIEKKGKDARFTIVGLWGNYILKPPADEYPNLPENEDLVMRLADYLKIPTVPHALIRLADGQLAFISKRIDRTDSADRLAMEDFCQISERLTEDKYKGSVERVGKLLRKFSVYPGLDAVDLFERILLSFACGNADMHLKNYSLIETPLGLRLSPACDLLSTMLAIPDDPEESALTINGKKSRLVNDDFVSLARSLEIPSASSSKIFRRLRDSADAMVALVNNSLLPQSMQGRLCAIMQTRLAVFG